MSSGPPLPVSPHAVPVVPLGVRVPEAIDLRLGALARAAQGGDLAARDAVYAALAPRLDPIVRAIFRRRTEFGGDPAIELDDLRQEGYLILIDLIQRWPGTDSLCGFVLSRFHWRLSAAYTGLAGSGRRASSPVPDVAGPTTVEEAGADGHTALRLMTASLPERQRAIVRLRVGGGYRQWQVAKALGIGRRTLAREWDRALATLRDSLETG